MEHQPSPIPIPSDFPIQWESPEDAAKLWTQDRQHAPVPYYPFSRWMVQHHQTVGGSAGLKAAGQPIVIVAKGFNTFRYLSVSPALPPEQMEEAGRRGQGALEDSLIDFAERWDEEWLPELSGYHDKWDSFDLGGADNEQLVAHLEWTLGTFRRLWEIHFEVAVPFLGGPSMFYDFYEDVFGSERALEAFRLLQGVENISFRAGRELWDLAKSVKSDAARSAIKDLPVDRVLEALHGVEGGEDFTGAFNAYVAKWGTRSDAVEEYAIPSWSEDPSTIVTNLKRYLEDDAEDPVRHWESLVEDRERAVKSARDHLRSYPEPVKQQFELLLAAGQQGQRIQEDHNWWIDQRGTHAVRRVLLEIGRRLAAAGAIADRDDVFYLDGDEILETAYAGFHGDRIALVEKRRAEMEKWAGFRPPPAIGTDHGPPPDSPISRAIGRFFGGPPPVVDPQRPNVIKGNPGAPGRYTGTVRVIVQLSEAGRLARGEVLVAPTTTPPWTPLFATAGAVVTDTGGPLSHCAIVAREYGLPAVVGTGIATGVIEDGQTVEVDGDAGEVRILTEN